MNNLMEDFPLFIVPDVVQTGVLSEEESHHASRVLRMHPGDRLYVTDGHGALYLAELSSDRGKVLPVHLLESVPDEGRTHPPLHVAVAPLKNADRTEWLLEKLVEVGLASLTLVMTDRTIRKHNNLTRLERVALAAMKQSRKRMMTRLILCDSMQEYLAQELPEQCFIAYCGEEYPKQELAKELEPSKSTAILIGPEGDFTPEEVKTAAAAGFCPVSLGRERLRTETAAIYAGMVHHVLNTQAE